MNLDEEDRNLISEIGEGVREKEQIKRDHFYSRRKLLARLFKNKLFRLGGIGVLLSMAVAFIAGAYSLPANSFMQTMAINLATGILLFVGLPTALRFAGNNPRRFLTHGIVLFFLFALLAFFTADVTQLLLANISVGILLVATLDHQISKILAGLEDDELATLADLKNREKEYNNRVTELAKKIEGAEDALDYKYALNEFLGIPRPYDFGGMILENVPYGIWPIPQDDEE